MRPLLKLALPPVRHVVLGSQAGRLRLGADLSAEVAAAADGRRGCVLRGGRGHGGRVERAGGGVVRRGEHGRGGRSRALARRERHHLPEEVCMGKCRFNRFEQFRYNTQSLSQDCIRGQCQPATYFLPRTAMSASDSRPGNFRFVYIWLKNLPQTCTESLKLKYALVALKSTEYPP